MINDDPWLAKNLNADGCHLGQKDIDILKARKILGKKIIGITCHNSKILAKRAIKNKADYLAFGAFFPTRTKRTRFKASMTILKKIKKITKKPVVARGGINDKNYKNLLEHADFLAISSYIFNNKNINPKKPLKN